MIKFPACLAMLVLSLAACAPASPPAAVQVTPLTGDAVITSEMTGQTLTLRVRSERGIGSARVELSDSGVKRVVIQLGVQGLEQLDFTFGETTVRVSVDSGDGTVREYLGDSEMLSGPDSPYWLPVQRVLSGQTPPANGYFEVQAPPAFETSQQRAFTLSWIDFYR